MAITVLNRSKLAKSLKKRLTARLPWLLKKRISKHYDEVPPASDHQEEEDENALNEAIEARLMEIIASSPAQETPVTFGYFVVPADPKDEIFSKVNLPMYQSRCQEAQAQTAC